MGPVVRRAVAADVAGIEEVLASAYRLRDNPDKAARFRRFASQWREFVVAELDGRVAGVAKVSAVTLCYGPAARLVKAEVGQVGVLEELQGSGVGTAVMRGVVEQIRASDIPLSRLGGYNKFYARFGYVPFPRRFYEFPLEPVKAGVSVLDLTEHLRLEPAELERIRPYHPARDGEQRAHLDERFNGGRLGALAPASLPAPATGGPDTSGLRWSYVDGDRLRGTVSAWVNGTEAQIHGIFDLRYPEAAAALVKTILSRLLGAGVTQAMGRLPFDPALEAVLNDAGVGFILREVWTAPASNMLLLADLRRFVAACAPEWTRRWRDGQAPDWSGVLELRVGDQTARVRCGDSGIEPDDGDSPPDASLECRPQDFLLMALGYRAYHELREQFTGAIPSPLSGVLTSLFQRQPTATGALG